MANINELLAQAAALRDETALNSISPERAGSIMYGTLLAMNELWLQQGAALVISKIYASVAAMEADTEPVSDLTGQPLRSGQIVVIASSDSDNGSVYRYNGPDSPSWSLVGNIGNLQPVDSLDSESTSLPLAAHQGKVLDGKISQLGQQVLNNFFVGDGQTYVKQDIHGLAPGRTYRIIPKTTVWDITGITGDFYKFVIRNNYNGSFTVLQGEKLVDDVKPYYDVRIPSSSDYIEIGGRAVSSLKVEYSIIDVTEVIQLGQNVGTAPHANAMVLRDLYAQLYNPNDEDYLDDCNINGTTGEITADDGYDVTGWIPVEAGEQFISNKTTIRAYYYTVDRQYIGRSFLSPSTAPTNAKWMRCVLSQSWIDANLIICKGSSISDEFQRKIYSSRIADRGIKSANIADKNVIPDKCSFFVPGKNLYNPNDADVVNGKYLSNTGSLESNSKYRVSGFIEFTQEMGSLVSSINGNANNQGGAYICLYDSSKSVVASSTLANSGGIATWQSGVAYARFSMYDSTEQFTNLQIEVGTQITSYAPYAVVLDPSLMPQNINGNNISDNSIPPAKLEEKTYPLFSAIGKERAVVSADTLSNSKLELTTFPRYIKQSGTVTAHALITAFNEIRVGFGVGLKNGLFAVIDNTNITLLRQYTDNGSTTTLGTSAHGLTISTFIDVAIYAEPKSVKMVLTTLGGQYINTYTFAMLETYGYPGIFADSTTSLTGVVLCAFNNHLKNPIWYIGDSYVTIDNARWPWYVNNLAEINKYLLMGLAGGGSGDLYPDLLKALNFGTPKYLIWGIGMNDKDPSESTANTNWTNYLSLLSSKCAQLGITLILTTTPNVTKTGYLNVAKNNIVKASDYRYIDFAKAVNAESAGASWYAGCLSSDELHPTALGAKVLAGALLSQLPEFIN